MAPSSRHLYPQWLRPGNARAAASAGTADPDRQLDGAWRVWERLRALDRRYATLVDVGLAVALFLLCAAWAMDHRGTPRPSLWFVAALIFPLVFRRRAPMTVFSVIATVAFVQWAVSEPGLADISLLVALYTVALESEWGLVLAAWAALEAGIVLAAVRWTLTGNDVKAFVFLTGLAFTALLTGVVVRALRSQLDWLAERAERLELERDQQASLAAAAERARIAREMHDVVSHNIQVMVTLADAASTAQTSDPTRSAEALRDLSTTGRQALTDMRRMLGVLRTEHPGDAPDPGPASPLAPQPGLADLDALVERVRGTGLAVSLERGGRPFAVSGAAGLSVYRIVQEALTNALKHAREPARVEVRLSFADPDLSVRVTDDGHAVPANPTGNGNGKSNAHATATAPASANVLANGSANGLGSTNIDGPGTGTRVSAPLLAGGHGVAGMAERAAAFGGSLQAGPRPGGGWEVAATLRDCKERAQK